MTEQDDQHLISETLNDDYDNPWKMAIERYFPEFMVFFFPEAYAQIDWSKEYIFLDQELQAFVKNAELGKRFVDKLVRVTLRNGNESCIYIHIEVQGSMQADFSKRIFVYNYRIYDRYDCPVASFVVLADANVGWKPTSFSYEVLGCKHTLDFPVAKLTDYRDKVDELLASNNPFALITAAHILTQQTRKKDQARYAAKLRLIKILYRLHWDKQKIIDLFTLVDWLMTLPKLLSDQILHEIKLIEEDEKMRYITSVERIGKAEGRLEGLLEGRHEGRHEGLLEGRHEGLLEGQVKGLVIGESKILKRQLERRFGALPSWVVNKIESASEQDLESWADAVLTAPTLDAVFDNEATH